MRAGSGEVYATLTAAMNSSALRATCTIGVKLRTTSGTAVETTGLPAAMYSSVFVGLIYRVASFNAKGIRQTSNDFKSGGSCAYVRWPSQWIFRCRGKAAGSTFACGPTMTTEPWG